MARAAKRTTSALRKDAGVSEGDQGDCMRIMFVCTGNVCRSPMAELLLRHYLRGSSIDVCSAGTRGLPGYPIDPSSARLMTSVGIDPDTFHSRRLTKTMAESADLILCFERRQCAAVA